MKISNIVFNGNEFAKKLAQNIKNSISEQQTQHSSFYSKYPKLAIPQLDIINVGNNYASLSYIKKKVSLGQKIGIKVKLHQFNLQYHTVQLETLSQITNQKDIIVNDISTFTKEKQIHSIGELIERLNLSTETSGIVVQLPLSSTLKDQTTHILQKIHPIKDVDCLSHQNRAKIIQNKQPYILPCTPNGIMKIFEEYNINLKGANAVVIGRSSIVGFPLFHLLLNENATVTLCHSHTANLCNLTKHADIVVSAVGVPRLVKQLKPGGVSIDVGINRNQNGKLIGDICEKAKLVSSLATPVPGGVGPLTVCMLMENTFKLWKKQMQSLRAQIT